MAAASVLKPFGRLSTTSPIPSSSSSSAAAARSAQPTPDPVQETTTNSKAFQRLKSSLEQSIRTATRSRKTAQSPTPDEFATLNASKGKGKEKEKQKEDEREKDKDKEKMNMLRRVTFRKPAAPKEEERIAGKTSYLTPSLRLASMSSPALHLSSQPFPSPKSHPPVIASSSSNTDALASPARPTSARPRKASISGPLPLPPKDRDIRHRSTTPLPPPSPSHHRDQRGRESPTTPTPARNRSTVTTTSSSRRPDPCSPPDTPDTPTPASRVNSRGVSPIPARGSAVGVGVRPHRSSVSKRGLTSASTSHLPLSSTSTSASPPPTPTRRRPSIDPNQSSHNPPSTSISTPSSAVRRPSLDAPRTTATTTRRTSIDAPSPSSTPTFTPPRSSSILRPPSSLSNRAESPSPVSPPASPIRPRAISPTNNRNYVQNRHFNISSGSLVLGSSAPPPLSSAPHHHTSSANPSRAHGSSVAATSTSTREVIRSAITLICREVAPPPPKTDQATAQARDWDEVESRVRGLVRLERTWAPAGRAASPGLGTLSTARRSSLDIASSGANSSASAEDRERRLFCEALRDGYVLCYLMNKLRQSSIVRPDPREDGVLRSGNITKFLAACASYGLGSEDLFRRDDLQEGKANGNGSSAKEAAARVARTIIKLVRYVEEGGENGEKERGREKWIRGGGLRREREREEKEKMAASTSVAAGAASNSSSPYDPASWSRASASTPNLSSLHTQQTPTSPIRAKRWTPPENMTPLRSSSPEGSSTANGSAKNGSSPESAITTRHENDGITPKTKTKTTTPDDVNEDKTKDKQRRERTRHRQGDREEDTTFSDARYDKPLPVPIMKPPPPPRSPLRKQPSTPTKHRTQIVAGDEQKHEADCDDDDEDVGAARGGLFAQFARKAVSPSPVSASGLGSASGSASGTASGAGLDSLSSSTSNHVPYPNRDSVADSTRASIGDASIYHQLQPQSPPQRQQYLTPNPMHRSPSQTRQSVASSAAFTETTDSSVMEGGRNSSLFGWSHQQVHNNRSHGAQQQQRSGQHGHKHSSSGGSNSGGMYYGTVRTVTTDLTSEGEGPSLSRTEGSRLAEEMLFEKEREVVISPAPLPASGMKRRLSAGESERNGGAVGGGVMYGMGMVRERKLSESPLPDLTRVAEETDESVSSKGKPSSGTSHVQQQRQRTRTRSVQQPQPQMPLPPTPQAQPHAQGQTQAHVNLRKGKWPDDFLDAFSGTNAATTTAKTSSSALSSTPSPAIAVPSAKPRQQAYHQDSSSTPPLSISPPRKLAIVGARTRSDSLVLTTNSAGGGEGGVYPQPRRPTHRPRHSIDAPVSASTLLPKQKESILRRDASPDSVSSSGRVVITRRHSTKPGMVGIGSSAGMVSSSPGGRQGGVYLPRGVSSAGSSAVAGGSGSNFGGGTDDAQSSSAGGSSDALAAGNGGGGTISASISVPFPRSVSGSGETPSPRSSTGLEHQQQMQDRPRIIRGRFQSDVEGSARRRARPNSLDELGDLRAGLGGRSPHRTRFESMVNLGAASASGGDSKEEGSAVRMRLVVREDGKPPTHFQLGNCIGRGQFGSVYRALNLNTGQMVAVKRIRLEGLKEEEVTTLMREVDLVKSLSHPSIVKYEGMARDDDTLSIVLEYAENGSLGQTLKSFGKLNEKLVASYVVKILEGLHYLHTSDVVHCDLKAANILTTKNGNVKLSDFGVSLNLRAMEREIKDVAGTPNWMAPEVIELKGASTKSDIWSLGCTVIELLTGKPPYAEVGNSMSVMFRIVEDDMPPIPEGCSEALRDFLEQCFHKDPTQRPDAEHLCEHPWLKDSWIALKDLRPQDSIPFLRRVSTDLHKSDAVRFFAQLDSPDSPVSASPKRDDIGKIAHINRRTSASSVRPGENEFSPREHTFVKTTFSKPMVCRVCLSSVKKTAVLCSQCSLISHSKCAVNAPPTCDLRAQLLLYAQYAEKGNPASLYSNPAEALGDAIGAVAMSDVSFVQHSNVSPRTSIDSPLGLPASPTAASANGSDQGAPPTAFRFMPGIFKRSRSNLSSEPILSSSAPSNQSSKPIPISKDARDGREADDTTPVKRRPTVLQKKERPLSATSTNTISTGLSSLRSAATAAESFSSRQNTGQRSQVSGASDAKGKDKASAAPDRSRSPPAASSKVPQQAATRARRTTSTQSETTTHTTADEHDPSTRKRSQQQHKAKAASSGNCIVQ
ncbi:hypothetical protein CPC08DRAFT_761081 [Agrocybe pediades]|nr:hypothetical protein CPC08DRAFT_761081 [Agrocybe pediades]